MKIVVYICSLLITLACIALLSEFGLERLLPEAYRGYLIEEPGGKVKWAIGPFEPSRPAVGYNPSIDLKKPAGTLRIVSLGASGTEGWLSAKTVFSKYAQPSESKNYSSYSRSIAFIMNEIADSTSKEVEVINLGIAAYNITDVIRMLKDSQKMDPDLFIIQLGGNETWTAGRSKWAAYVNDDIPYFYSELGYEILTEIQAGWRTLGVGDDAFNPLALFTSRPRPIVVEPPGRASGLVPRLENYRSELARLATFLQNNKVPVLFLLPPQNLADFRPFGSMAKPDTTPALLEELNTKLISALDAPVEDAKDAYLEILRIDDGIAEANFQIGQYYLRDNEIDKAREHLWKANDRDLILKRVPSSFHDISRSFVLDNAFPYIDTMNFYASKSTRGIVGYDWLDDDVHPGREGQFELGAEIVREILVSSFLDSSEYRGSLEKIPNLSEYNQWTGFDREAAATISYLKGTHNFAAFGRYRQRIQWDPQPARFLEPIIAELDTANSFAPSDASRYMSAMLNLFLGRQDQVEQIISDMNCGESQERAVMVNQGMSMSSGLIFGQTRGDLKRELQQILVAQGCNK